jgi:SAM-dependent methyltransferase
LLLSYIERLDAMPEQLQLLEAGCGRGVNLTAAARLQPEDQFTGIDINRVAIEEASANAQRKGLSNLKFHNADLLDPATLPGVGRGYDVILSYGVIHHLSDPMKGLQQLTQQLAPHGVLALMLDGRYGRQPLDRLLQALEVVAPTDCAESDRESLARALAHIAEHGVFHGNCWQGTASENPVEFADRCLHVHEQSYDIEALWQLLDRAGLKFIRWIETDDWSVERLSDNVQLIDRLQLLEPIEAYRLIERLTYRPKLTLVVARKSEQSRQSLSREAFQFKRFCLNPQLKLFTDESGQQQWLLRGRTLPIAEHGLEHLLLMTASEIQGSFTCAYLIQQVTETSFGQEQGLDLFARLYDLECFYAPHLKDQDVP